MGLLREGDRKFLTEQFSKILKEEIKALIFKEEGCKYCDDTERLMKEVAELSNLIKLETYSVQDEKARKYEVEGAPTLILTDAKEELNGRVVFLGTPMGYEFTTLIKDIMMISSHHLEITNEAINALSEIDASLKIEVYVTPACPYCPSAVMLAHQAAMVSERIKGVMVEASQFPQKAEKWGVMGVPHTVIQNLEKGNTVQFIGSYPEKFFLDFLKDAAEGKEFDTR